MYLPRKPGESPPRVQEMELEVPKVRAAVEQLFTPPFLARLLAAAPTKYRARVLRIEVVALALLHFVTGETPSFLMLVDSLRGGTLPGLQAMEVTPSAFYKRLHVLPHTVFLELLRVTTQTLEGSREHRRKWVGALAPFAKGIYAIDDTTLDALMRRTSALMKFEKGASETLGGRLGCALDLETGAFAEVLYDADSAANEKTHIRPLIERLSIGALFVMDLGYFAFPFFDYLTNRGCFFVSRLKAKVSYVVLECWVDLPNYRESTIALGKHRADRAEHSVRLVELLIGGTWYRYITNVLDPKMLSADKLWALYGLRWSIELSFAAVKRALGLAYLRACHTNGLLIQIWCTLSVYQVMQDLRLTTSAANGWNDDAVSWTNLMRRIAWYAKDNQGKTLRNWLADGGDSLFLRKRGLRKRRATELPAAVLIDVRAAAGAGPPQLAPRRKARQGKPRPRKPGAPLVIAGLS
jgi:hypothetical protein